MTLNIIPVAFGSHVEVEIVSHGNAVVANNRNKNFGEVKPGRRLAFLHRGRWGTIPEHVVLGGSPATMVWSQTFDQGTADSQNYSLWIAEQDTSASGPVDFIGDFFVLCAVYGLDQNDVTFITRAMGQPAKATINVSEGSAVVGFANMFYQSGDKAATWTGLTERVDTIFKTSVGSIINNNHLTAACRNFPDGATGHAVRVDFSNPNPPYDHPYGMLLFHFSPPT